MIASPYSPYANDGTSIFTLSSNPPNPKLPFRAHDWICALSSCGAHNFARNLCCINCNTPRSSYDKDVHAPAVRPPFSPRFAGLSQDPIMSPQASQFRPPALKRTSLPLPAKPAMPSPKYPLLTPSGRSFASGGQVQNISADPSNPICVFWPANEPFPQPGQMRPPVHSMALPPIMNTGAKGPIEHQPGDWICTVCQYLNWRRRKVCQACFPYAEGNGDSISSNVQAERVALLTSALANTTIGMAPIASSSFRTCSPLAPTSRSASVTPPPMRPVANMPGLASGHTRTMGAVNLIAKSRSQFDLRSSYASRGTPIYQTSGHSSARLSGADAYNHRSLPPSPLTTITPMSPAVNLLSHGPESAVVDHSYLPSFLNDIVASPALSTTSSADLSSIEDLTLSTPPHARSDLPRSTSLNSSIWGLDGEEQRTWGNLRSRQSRETLTYRH